jgi:zinc protease
MPTAGPDGGIDRSTLPRPGPSRPFIFPPLEKSTLQNGLRVWSVSHDAVPLVTLVLLIATGSSDDPVGGEGLAALTADMLDEGSGGRSAIEMHEALAGIGAQLNAEIDADAMTLGLTTLSRFVGTGLSVMADMVVRPALREDDFLRVRRLRQNRLAQLRDMPSAVAERTFLHLLYGADPYGHSPLGNAKVLDGLTLDDVRAFHASRIRPGAATLVAVGDCTHDEVRRHADEAFGCWTAGSPDVPRRATETLPPTTRLAVAARPGAAQSELRIGQVAVARDTDDYFALVTANTVLGGQFVSRVNLNLRQSKGFTYGARTWFEFRRRPGPFSLQTSVHTASTAEAIAECLNEIGAIRRSRPVTAAELELAVAALTRGFARNFETAGQIARAVAQIARHGLADDHYTNFVSNIAAVTPGAATDALFRHLDPERLTTLVVGDLDAVGESLQALSLGAPTIVATDAF